MTEGKPLHPWGRTDVPPEPTQRDYGVILNEAMHHADWRNHYVRVVFEPYAHFLANPVYTWDCKCPERRH